MGEQVEPHLYAAGDASVCPTTPAALRSGGGRAAGAGTGAGRGAAESVGGGLPCGFADAPGWRIEMEDAVCRCVGLLACENVVKWRGGSGASGKGVVRMEMR